MLLRRVLPCATALALSCGSAAVPVPTVPPRPTVVPSRAPVAAQPTVLWTAPAQAGSLRTEPPASPPAAPVTAAPPDPTPRPTSTARVTPTPTTDPFRWTTYELSGGPVVYLPATWTTVDPVVLRGAFAFAASPEPPHPLLAQYIALMTMDWFATTPTLTLNAFADAYGETIGFLHPVRESGTHPSGPAVFFSYRDTASYQHVDAIVAANGRIATVRMRAPVDRWAPHAGVFQQIVQRFRLR